jgi:ribose 5-phosphate isomerase B
VNNDTNAFYILTFLFYSAVFNDAYNGKSMRPTIAFAADHAGYELKEILKAHAIQAGFDVHDCGTNSNDSVDYPEIAARLTPVMTQHTNILGIALCGSGIGISIALNRSPHNRAALCHNVEMAQLARQHNDANILALGTRFIDKTTAIACLDAFANTAFAGGRHQRRVDQLSPKRKES